MMQYFRIWFDGEYDNDLCIECPKEQFSYMFNFLDLQSIEILRIDVFYRDIQKEGVVNEIL